MNKVMSSPVIGTIEVTDHSIKYKTLLKNKEIMIEDIDYIDCTEGSLTKNGELTLKENGNIHRIMFNQKFNSDIKDLVAELNITNKEIIPTFAESLDLMIPKSYKVIYLGGHPGIKKEGDTTINIANNKVTLGNVFQQFQIDNITNARLESETEIRSRYTATRIALLGIFAFAFKKYSKKNNKFLTIECEHKGVPISVVFTGDNVVKAYGPIVDVIAVNKKLNSNAQPIEDRGSSLNQHTGQSFSKADEIIKLKTLLEEGIITSDEFETEKKKILSK